MPDDGLEEFFQIMIAAEALRRPLHEYLKGLNQITWKGINR
jgi:hypothetical protein